MKNLKVWKFSFPNLFDSYRDSFVTLLPEVFKSLIQNLEVKYSVNFSRIMAHKNMWVFSHDKVENKLFKASVFWTNDSRIHRHRKTRLLWLMWLSTQRIGKNVRASSYFFTRRAVDVASKACFTVMTRDRHNELATMDFSMIIFAQTLSWSVWILTV